MAGLSVKGDPDGWLDSGRAVSTLMAQLESELADANRVSGAGLASLWQGPAASAFTSDWVARRSRYEDLIDNARQVAQAITGYGEKLLGLVQAAANLESTWCSVGLHLLESGAGFVLPPGFESMPAGTQLSLSHALTQSENDVKKLADDAEGAAEDLAAAIGAALTAMLDFQLIEVGALATVGAAALKYVIADVKDPVNDVREVLDHYLESVRESAADAAGDAKMFATQVSYYLREGTAGERSAAAKLLPDAGRDATAAASKLDLLTGGMLLAANGITAVQVISGARHEGYRVSLEQHAGDVASTLTTDALVGVAIACPEVAPGLVATAIVAVGVGFAVQEVVDHRKAIGHFIEDVF